VSRRAGKVARLGAYAVVPVLALAGFFLTAHLGKPERGLAFPLFFTNYDSWMTRGGWIVGTSAPFMVVYAVLWYLGVAPALRRVVGLLGLAPAVGLGLYTGFLLSGSMFVPLWNRGYLPLLFLNSGVNTGLALVGLLALLAWPWAGVPGTSARPAARWLGAALLVFVVLEGVELYRFMRDLASQGLLRGHAAAATADRFRYEVAPGGQLAPGTYVVAVTWVNNATGAEEGMSAETPVTVGEGGGPARLLVTAPRRLGLTYNVYLGASRRDARQVAGNLSPGETVEVHDLAPASLTLPENLQTGGLFVEASGGPAAYRYVTGGPAYPWRLLDRGRAAAASDALRGFPAAPTLVRDAPRSSLAGWFWWGVVGLALVAPVALTAVELVAELGRPAWANGVAAVKFAAVLAGGLILRFVVVWGGDLKAPLAFPPQGPFPGLPLPGPTLPGLGG
jgi:formate-dependent nitrite reductase membrane component NrfD